MKITRYNMGHIGGSIVKITSSDNRSILIDYGTNLDGSIFTDLPPLDDVKAILISHFHLDHVGMLDSIKDIPIYVNKDAYYSYKMYSNKIIVNNFYLIEEGKEYFIDRFKIESIVCSHSAYKSQMYLINVDKLNILHTGDFRLHGIENNLDIFNRFTNKIDLLITEGTNITNNLEAKSENYLKQEFIELQDKYKYIYILTSSTNYERIKIISESVKRGRYFIVDNHQKNIIDSWNIFGNNKAIIYGENILEKAKKRGFVMIVKSNDYFKKIMDKFPKDNSVLVYSMWRGYIDNNDSLKEFLGNDYIHIHTSGHISQPDLERFINKIKPKNIMMIHSENNDLLHELNINSNILDDKEAILE